jgi:hypothetical protein
LFRIEECEVSADAVVEWWRAFLEFLATDRHVGLTNGLIRNNRMFLFAQFEKDVPANPPMLRGIADLKSNDGVTEIMFPVMNGAAENAPFADAETTFVTAAYCYLRRHDDQLLYPITYHRVQASDDRNTLGEPFYDGYWSCIRNTDALGNGDTIEFGAQGSRDFSVNATWEIRK